MKNIMETEQELQSSQSPWRKSQKHLQSTVMPRESDSYNLRVNVYVRRAIMRPKRITGCKNELAFLIEIVPVKVFSSKSFHG